MRARVDMAVARCKGMFSSQCLMYVFSIWLISSLSSSTLDEWFDTLVAGDPIDWMARWLTYAVSILIKDSVISVHLIRAAGRDTISGVISLSFMLRGKIVSADGSKLLIPMPRSSAERTSVVFM